MKKSIVICDNCKKHLKDIASIQIVDKDFCDKTCIQEYYYDLQLNRIRSSSCCTICCGHGVIKPFNTTTDICMNCLGSGLFNFKTNK